jgi:hypothetical protein
MKRDPTSAQRSPRGKYYPFRTLAVERYERPEVPTVPVIAPHWRWWPVILGLCLAAASGLVRWL